MPLRLSYTQITRTARMALISAGHGNPSFTASDDVEVSVAAWPVCIWPQGHTVLFRTSSGPGQFLIPCHQCHTISPIPSCIFLPCPITSNYPPLCSLITRQSPGGPYKGPFLYSLSLVFIFLQTRP